MASVQYNPHTQHHVRCFTFLTYLPHDLLVAAVQHESTRLVESCTSGSRPDGSTEEDARTIALRRVDAGRVVAHAKTAATETAGGGGSGRAGGADEIVAGGVTPWRDRGEIVARRRGE